SLPPAVTSLTATSLLFGIALKWTFPPGAEDTQRTEIWYSQTTDLAKATKLSDLAYPQSEYIMQGLLAGVTFFFWARLVDRTGNVGPWYPTGIGVMGQTSSDAGPILEMIAGQIGETELGQGLLDKIDGLQGQIDALDGLKAYDPDLTYEKGQMVVVDGRIYQAEQAVPVNTSPPNAAYWEDVGDLLQTANGLAGQVATHSNEISELEGVVTSQATSTQSLSAAYREDNGEGDLQGALKLWDAQAAYSREVVVRASQNDALVTATETLQANVGSNTAAVQQVSQAQASSDGKLATMWSVKMQVTQDGRYVAAGIGLGIENTGAGLQSQFLVSADRFAIIGTLAGGGIYTPFVVQGGQVFVNQAFIQDASIGVAKLTQSLQSSNYIAGQQGLKINFVTGEFEFNSATGDGGRQTINNAGGKVYDENQMRRYQWGNLKV
ncbi:host specificity protein, partial [Pseudomonas amygdali pv. morsprunorum]